MRELDDVQAAGGHVSGQAGQVAKQVVEGEQVAQGVQHGDGQVELAGDGEVTHVGLHDGQGDIVRRR